MGPALNHSADEGFHKIVVLGAAYPLMTPTDVDRIFKALHVVGADVEQYRQTGLRVNAGARRVERQLTDGDAEASCTLITEPENTLAVADYNRTDCVVAR
jgi:hypothetical protein